MDGSRHFVKPGCIEVYCGAMKSGKTRELLHRLDQLSYLEDVQVLLVKHGADTRSKGVFTRTGQELPCIRVTTAQDILVHVKEHHRVVAIDEAQFFDETLIDVILALAKHKRHILIAGLEMNYRAEPFGIMPLIMCHATLIHKQHAICDIPGCNNIATLPQRLKNGKPAHYDEPLVVIDGEERYEARCVHHHVVPGKPLTSLAVDDTSLHAFLE